MWRKFVETQGVNVQEQLYFWAFTFVTGWLDSLWIPVAALVTYRDQRWKAIAFVLLCMITMRLQIEIVHSLGYENGFTGWLKWPLIYRGYCVYGFFTALYLLLSWLSPRTSGAIYLAASLSIFFMAFVVSTVVLII